jgi:hypothetical protein
MIFLLAMVVGFAFGAADQYLGTIHITSVAGTWTISVSLMSAPWLLLPFAFGATQERARRAMLVGLASTLAAFAGYYAMTVSPAEGVALANAPQAAVNVVRANLVPANPVIPAGLVTGPLFGLLGQRWRVQRSWTGPVLVAGAFLLEPFAHEVRGNLLGPSWIWAAEVALGVCLLGYFLVSTSGRGRTPRPA